MKFDDKLLSIPDNEMKGLAHKQAGHILVIPILVASQSQTQYNQPPQHNVNGKSSKESSNEEEQR